MARFQPEKLLRTLIQHRVELIVIGGVAATLHGSNLRTGDVDVCPRRSRENLKRLARALRELEAKVRAPGAPDGIPFDPDPGLLEGVELLNLTTLFGDFDVVFQPPGVAGFEELWKGRVTFDLDGVAVAVASLDDLIRTKEVSGRKKDLDQLPTLRALRELASG
jgi:hypothetical protein